MKIGIDISQIVYPGGVGVYTKNLISHLVKIDGQDQYVFFAASLRKKQLLETWFSQLKKKATKTNVQSRFFPLPPVLTQLLFNQLRFTRIEIFTGKIDLFHTSDWTEPKTNCSKVTTVHDLAPLIYPHLHHPKIVKVFSQKLALVKRESDFIIAVSKSTKKDLVNKLGIKSEKIKVIYEALDDDFKKAEPDISWFKSLDLGNFIVSDAIKNPRKNLKNLLRAFEKVKNKKIKLVLVGQPLWQQKELEALLEKSVFKNRIVKLDRVSLAQLKALYQKAKLAVFPSFYEGFGLPLLEALSCGCPVVCSDNSSFPEIGGKEALYCSPNKPNQIAQKINQLIENPDLRLELKQAAKKQIKKFSWQKTAKETLEAYQEAVR